MTEYVIKLEKQVECMLNTCWIRVEYMLNTSWIRVEYELNTSWIQVELKLESLFVDKNSWTISCDVCDEHDMMIAY